MHNAFPLNCNSLRASHCTAKYQLSQSSLEYTTKEMSVVHGLYPLQLNRIICFWGEGHFDSAFSTWTSLRGLLTAVEDSTLNRHACLPAGSSAWTRLWEIAPRKTEKQQSVICRINCLYQIRKCLRKTRSKAAEKKNFYSYQDVSAITKENWPICIFQKRTPVFYALY